MAIRFFMTAGNTVVQLPVNPSQLVISTPGNNKTETVVKLGEINILKEPKLHTLVIESFLPANANAPYVLTKGRFQPPDFYLRFFENLMVTKSTLKLRVTDTKIDETYTVEDFEQSIKSGTDDVEYKITLKKYVPYGAKEVTLISTGDANTPATAKVEGAVRPKNGFAIGDTVTVSGKYWYDSYGATPYGVFTNFTGKISHIVADTTRKYRYHIVTVTGGYRGWVDASQIRLK